MKTATRTLGPLLVLVLIIVPLWIFPYVPMTDAPNHLLAAFIAVHYQDPRFSFPRYFTVDLTPRSNVLGHYLMIALLKVGFSPEDTLRLFATLIVLLSVGSLYLLLRVARGQEHARTWFWLGIPLAYTWYFHQGFLNFTLSVPLALLTLAWGIRYGLWGHTLVKGSQRDWARGVLGGTILAYLTYLAHSLGLALVLTAAAALVLGDVGVHLRERRARALVSDLIWVAVPFVLLATIVVLTGRLSPNVSGEASAFLSPPFIVWAPLSKKVAELRYGLFSFSPRREQWILTPAAGVILLSWIFSWRKVTRWHGPYLLSLVFYFLLPMGFWVPFIIYERFWLFTLLLLPLALPTFRSRSLRLAVQGLLALTALLFLINVTNDYRIANRNLRAYDAVLDQLPEQVWAFPFTYHHQGRISPARHFWAYAMMRKDVFIPMVFAETYHPVQYRPEVRRPYPLAYENGFFAEHAHNRATLWVRASDPLMQKVTLPKLADYGYVRVGQVGPYWIFRLATWPPPVPDYARPHITPEVANAYSILLVYGYPPTYLIREVEEWYDLQTEIGLSRMYRRTERAD